MKIGFIAISGVRVTNTELLEAGLNLPGFVERSKVIASLPSLGLLTLAALTPDSVDIEYLEVDDLPENGDLPGHFNAVAISSFTARIKDTYELARRFRARGTIVILGGLHVSACPEEAMAHADWVVVGEGEVAWPQVVADLQAGSLQSRYDTRSTPFDLKSAPIPRFDLLDPQRYNRLTVQTSRGCPFSCEFCAASRTISPKYKVKPIDQVIEEVRAIKAIWPHPFIELADDNTFVLKKRSRELLIRLRDEKIRWFTETDISVADDSQLLHLMREAGCAQVLIGLESPTRKALEGLEGHANWKAGRQARYIEAIRRIQDHGITVNGCFVMGMDGTGPESFDDVYDFVQESGLFEVQATILTPFPGTPLYRRLQASGRLLDETAWEKCTLFDVNFIPEHMTPFELETRFRELIQALYADDVVKIRQESFKKRLKSRRRLEHLKSA